MLRHPNACPVESPSEVTPYRGRPTWDAAPRTPDRGRVTADAVRKRRRTPDAVSRTQYPGRSTRTPYPERIAGLTVTRERTNAERPPLRHPSVGPRPRLR